MLQHLRIVQCLLVLIIRWVPVPVLRMVEHRGGVSGAHLRRDPVGRAHRRLIWQVWPAGGSSSTSSPSPSSLRLPRRSERRNVAVGAPSGDHRIRILHRPRRRLWVPENHESVALGAAGLAIVDHDGLENFSIDLKVLAQPLRRRLPRQPANEDFRERGVAEPRAVVVRSAAGRRRVAGG